MTQTTSSPPPWAVEWALDEAARAPCTKSSRGVAIFDNEKGIVVAGGFNGPPWPMKCDGSEACRRDCPKICMHAEQRAVMGVETEDYATDESGARNLQHLDLLHVKRAGGKLVPGGPPSCWQCSRIILDVMIGGVWLYEADELQPECPGEDCPMCNGEDCNICAASYGGEACDHDVVDRHKGEPLSEPIGHWRRYTAEEFHRHTLANAKDGPLHAAKH